MEVIFYTPVKGKLYNIPILDKGEIVYAQEDKNNIGWMTKAFFKEVYDKVPDKVYMVATSDIVDVAEVIVSDVIVDGKSLFKTDYRAYTRFVGVIDRNHTSPVGHHSVNPRKLWEPSRELVRRTVKEKVEHTEDYFEEAMAYNSELTHHEVLMLWSLTHGIAFTVKPFNMEGDYVYLDEKHEVYVSYAKDIKPFGFEIFKLGVS